VTTDAEIARLRAEAKALRAESEAAMDRGDADAATTALMKAIVRERVADGLGSSTGRNNSGITSEVTRAQSKRRGRAIAKGKATSVIAKAIAKDDRWGSLTKYAKHLRISQPALSRYLSGDLDVPPEVAAAVLADFGLDADAWPKRRK
jgi:hypothetical protein